MSDSIAGKVIWYWIAWVLSICWVSVYVTNDDVAREYKKNTWKELQINEGDFSSFEEVANRDKETISTMLETYNSLDCNYEYPSFHDTCPNIKESILNVISALYGEIECMKILTTKDDLERSDLLFCIEKEKEWKESWIDFNKKVLWYCWEKCQQSIDSIDYNIALFQAYLNKVK